MELDLSYVEYPLKVLDQKERSSWQKVVKMYKVQWSHHKVVKMYKVQWSHHIEEEATSETESYLNQNFHGFLDSTKGTALSTLSRLS